ncbi:hypothetical protein AYO41_05320 [Verrucomicrobia bacterium SCGC AG-212-E04]|nr:hypothetical protein AYO41_05320 [Verrucomicrobia bacterium SCGC AG-212-E04]
MDFLSTGIQEVARRLRRRNLRRSWRAEERRLEQSEVELGREGWREVANTANVEAGLAELLVPLHRLDAEGAETRAKLAEAEREIATQREEEAVLRRQFAEEMARLEAERAPLRRTRDEQKQEAAAAGVAAGSAHGEVPAETPHLQVLQQLQEMDQREAAIHERRREAERAATTKSEALGARLRPLQAAQEQLEQARRAPLRALGKYLADHEDAVPPAATRHVAAVRNRRQHMQVLEQREIALAHESRQADPQSLRLSLFVFTTFAVFAALALLLIFRAPPRRDWLPANTELIISANVSRLSSASASQVGNSWNAIWTATVLPLAGVPTLENTAADVRRVVRATGFSEPGRPVEYNLVEIEDSAGSVVSALNTQHGFGQRFDSARLGGLPIYERSTDLAVAQIGPATITVGRTPAVEEMIRVRLGLSRDLKLDEQFYEKFQRLDRGSAFRFVTRRPEALIDAAGAPLFATELLGSTRLLGFAARNADPVACVFLFRAESAAAATRLSNLLRERGPTLVRLAGGGSFAEPPALETRDSEVEMRFVLTGATARDFLTRLAGTGLSPGIETPR